MTMTRGDVGRLLAYMAAFDKRTIGDADILAWHDAIGDLDYPRAKDAICAWFKAHNEGWLMPADVREGCRTRPELKSAEEAILEAGGDPSMSYRAELAPALATVTALRTIPKPTGYRPNRPHPQRPKKGPETDDQRAKAGKAVTVCHRCAVDISVPDGWDPNSEKSPAIYCGRCTAGRRKEGAGA